MNDKTMLELLPCPFCGGMAAFQSRLSGRYQHAVACNACEARTGGTMFKNDNYNSQCWNTRAPLGQTLPPKTGA